MADVSSLVSRIDAEFSKAEQKVKNFQKQQVDEFHGREKRLEQFAKILEGLRDVWKPRLEALARKFGDRVNVQPTVEPALRQAVFAFSSNLAQIRLRFSVATNLEVTKVVFSYDLEILPVLMKFESHSELEFPLERVDEKALAKWLDDRVVSFVTTYLSLNENQYYLKDHMVEDPVAHVSFPKYAAGATLEVDGKTYYFVGEETRAQFQKLQQKAEKGAKTATAAKAADTPAKTAKAAKAADAPAKTADAPAKTAAAPAKAADAPAKPAKSAGKTKA